MSSCLPPIGERLHPPTRLASLVAALAEDGIAAADVLRGTGLSEGDFDDRAPVPPRTSIAQYLAASGNALARSPASDLAFRLGARSRLSDHGLYGLLLSSCGSVGELFRLAVRYQWLSSPIVASDAIESDDTIAWTIDGGSLGDVPAAARRFVVEAWAAERVAQMREVLGDGCVPTVACFTHAAPAHAALYAERLRCRCVFDAPRNELRYPAAILSRRPPLANPLAVGLLEATCDGLVAEMEASLGVAGQVVRLLRRMRDPAAPMKVVASELKMTDRTLRRRLANEGTCFSTISHRAKFAVATRHLESSAASIDEVATIAGFSDPANFRRAFIRWTSMSPAQFRRSRPA